MNNQTQVLKNSVFKSLSAINAASKKSAKGWDKKAITIPIELYFEVIKAAKWEKHPTNKIANDYIGNYNLMLDLLFKAAKSSAFKFGVESVPLEFIAITIDKVKDAFLKGMKKDTLKALRNDTL